MFTFQVNLRMLFDIQIYFCSALSGTYALIGGIRNVLYMAQMKVRES